MVKLSEGGCPVNNGTRECHYNETDEDRDYVNIVGEYFSRSHWPCGDTSDGRVPRCVREADMCRGTSLCPDNSDREFCLSDSRTCPTTSYHKCDNGECIPKNKVNNTVFDCHDRSDEVGSSEIREQNIDLDKLLTECDSPYGPGLYCGEIYSNSDCLEINGWCTGSVSYTHLTLPTICSV